MFNRSKKIIVLSVIASLVLFLFIMQGIVCLSSLRDIRRRNMEMLERYISLYSLNSPPGSGGPPDAEQPGNAGRPAPNGERPASKRSDEYELSFFCSVAYSPEGEILAVDEGRENLYSRDVIIDTAGHMLKKRKHIGRFGNFFYIVKTESDYTLVAFTDNTLSDNTIYTFIKNTLIAGGFAAVALFFPAIILSRKIIAPLELSDARQRRFVSDAGHELKTPIAVISANTDLLEKKYGGNEWLSNIRYECDRMGTLVRELLELSKTEETPLRLEKLEFGHLVSGEVLPFEGAAYERGLRIDMDIDADVYITGERARLCRMVSVLIDNAISYADPPGEIKVSLSKEKNKAILSVTNRAKDLSGEDTDKLFERFYRADKARTGDDGHYGLGLSIAKAAAEAHGGRITVSYRDGCITFTVSLPVI